MSALWLWLMPRLFGIGVAFFFVALVTPMIASLFLEEEE
jgi:hypothetical protein